MLSKEIVVDDERLRREMVVDDEGVERAADKATR